MADNIQALTVFPGGLSKPTQNELTIQRALQQLARAVNQTSSDLSSLSSKVTKLSGDGGGGSQPGGDYINNNSNQAVPQLANYNVDGFGMANMHMSKKTQFKDITVPSGYESIVSDLSVQPGAAVTVDSNATIVSVSDTQHEFIRNTHPTNIQQDDAQIHISGSMTSGSAVTDSLQLPQISSGKILRTTTNGVVIGDDYYKSKGCLSTLQFFSSAVSGGSIVTNNIKSRDAIDVSPDGVFGEGLTFKLITTGNLQVNGISSSYGFISITFYVGYTTQYYNSTNGIISDINVELPIKFSGTKFLGQTYALFDFRLEHELTLVEEAAHNTWSERHLRLSVTNTTDDLIRSDTNYSSINVGSSNSIYKNGTVSRPYVRFDLAITGSSGSMTVNKVMERVEGTIL